MPLFVNNNVLYIYVFMYVYVSIIFNKYALLFFFSFQLQNRLYFLVTVVSFLFVSYHLNFCFKQWVLWEPSAKVLLLSRVFWKILCNLNFSIVFNFLYQNHFTDSIIPWSITITTSIFSTAIFQFIMFWFIAEIICKWTTLPFVLSIIIFFLFFFPAVLWFVMERLVYMSGKMY